MIRSDGAMDLTTILETPPIRPFAHPPFSPFFKPVLTPSEV